MGIVHQFKYKKSKKFITLLSILGLIFGAVYIPSYGADKAEAIVPYTNVRISTDSSGNQANANSAPYGTSDGPISMSKDGRYVVFASAATNLVAGDSNGKIDIFRKDTTNGNIVLVSQSTSGILSNGDSMHTAISYNGRYIAFGSIATNLSGNNVYGTWNVYLRDVQLGTTEAITLASTGYLGNNQSAQSYSGMSVSRDGRFVAFDSLASNLVSGDTNGAEDIFVKDRILNTITRVNVDSSGNQANSGSGSRGVSMSCDGAIIAFNSSASNLVSGDTNGVRDVFLVNRIAGNTITDITIGGNGDSYGSVAPSVSCDGSTVAFASDATNLVVSDTNSRLDIFTYDIGLNSMERLSVDSSGAQSSGNSGISGMSISGDGRYVTFNSDATDLVSSDTNARLDVFLRDRKNGTTEMVSKRNSSTQTTDTNSIPGISPDGQYIAYYSEDPGLVSGDTNGNRDIFLATTGAEACSL